MTPKSNWRYFASALAGALLTLLVVFLWTHNGKDAETEEAMEKHGAEVEQAQTTRTESHAIKLTADQLAANGIKLETATPGRFASVLNLPGQLVLDGDHEARVLTAISGTVREIRVQTGAQVSAGAILAVLESRELAEANAQYLSARERHELAAANFIREEGLWQKKISAEQDYLLAKKELADARIEERSALQKLLALGISEGEVQQQLKGSSTLARYPLRTPIAGTVLSRDLTLGEALSSDKPVFHIADLHRVWVDLAVPAGSLSAIKVGQRVLVRDSATTLSGEGKVLFVQPELDSASRAGSVRVAIDNRNGQWRPGMYVTTELVTGDQEAVFSVPEGALQTLDGKTVLFVQGKEGFAPRGVVLGRKAQGRVEIRDGLQSGERYAASVSFILKSELKKGETKDED